MGMTSQRVRDRLIERLRADRHPRRARAQRDPHGAAPPVRRRSARHARLRRHRAADRPRADDFAAVGGGEDDRGAARTPRAMPPKRVLEIGTGSGYQAAILAALGHGSLHRRAHRRTAAHRAQALPHARLQRAQQARRRPHRLAGTRAVRRDHRHRRRARAGRCADRRSSRRAARWWRRSAAAARRRCCACARMPTASSTKRSSRPSCSCRCCQGWWTDA